MDALVQVAPAVRGGPALDNRRVLAGIVDLALLAVVGFALGLVTGVFSPAIQALGIGWALYYYFALESGGGQTVGKKLLGIRVVRADGSPAGMREVAIRTLVRMIDGIGFYLVGLVVMLISGERRQRLGDILADTVIVPADTPLTAAGPVSPAEEAPADPGDPGPPEETLVEEPTVEEPVAEEPVAREPALAEPVVQEPVVEEPVVQEPVVEVAAPRQPVAPEEPLVTAVAEPLVTSAETTAEQRASEDAVADMPAVEVRPPPPPAKAPAEDPAEPPPAEREAADEGVGPLTRALLEDDDVEDHRDAPDGDAPDPPAQALPEEPVPADSVKPVDTVSAIDLVMQDDEDERRPA